MRKGGLGRGVEALLGEGIAKSKFIEVPIDSLLPSDNQPRIDRESDLDELVESIKRHGILQPILVSRESGGGYRIVAGERRWLAAKKAGLTKVPVVVGEWSDRERAIIALVENLQRKNLDPIEEAVYYERLSVDYGFSHDEIAELVGKSRSHISNVMRILSLPDDVKRGLREGLISLGHAKALLSLKDKAKILEVYNKTIESSLTVRELEELVRRIIREEREKKLSRRKIVKLKGEYEGVRLVFMEGRKKLKVLIEGPNDSVNKLINLIPID